jgi:hypothetical protein
MKEGRDKITYDISGEGNNKKCEGSLEMQSRYTKRQLIILPEKEERYEKI